MWWYDFVVFKSVSFFLLLNYTCDMSDLHFPLNYPQPHFCYILRSRISYLDFWNIHFPIKPALIFNNNFLVIVTDKIIASFRLPLVAALDTLAVCDILAILTVKNCFIFCLIYILTNLTLYCYLLFGNFKSFADWRGD